MKTRTDSVEYTSGKFVNMKNDHCIQNKLIAAKTFLGHKKCMIKYRKLKAGMGS